MNDGKRKGVIVFVLIWGAIITIGGLGWKFVIKPWMDGSLSSATGSESQYKDAVRIDADAFSGYAFLRSPAMVKTLREDGIKLGFHDDKADYNARLEALRDGKSRLAVFTLDAYIKAGAKLGYTSAEQFPGSIVLVIDQTVGADAMVAYQEAVPALPAMNHPEAKFVFTPDSPSDFLARVVTGQLSFPLLPDDWFVAADGAEDVLKRLRATNPKDKRVFVLWEPFLSEALKIPGIHKVFGSDQCNNCIVDILVARREFLAERPDVVKRVVAAYFAVSHSYHQTEGGVADLVIEDAKAGGDALTREQAERIVQGIQWKRVRENYAHFGIEGAQGLQNLEELIAYVTKILLKTKAIATDPIGGKASKLYFDGVMRELHAEEYHPGKKVNIIDGLGPTAADLDEARKVAVLPTLDDAGWAQLVPVGTARVEPVGFHRGTAEISEFSRGDLGDLAKALGGSFSTYYLRVVGRAFAQGDAAANATLARERATATKDYLVNQGVAENRIRTESVPPSKDGGAAEVQFVLVQARY